MDYKSHAFDLPAAMKTVLIIDDDKRLVAALAIRLRAAGYAVLKATDGLEGLKLAADRRPDLVLMDVWMPGGVGILIAQRLKHIGLAGIPVIFLTASKKKDLWEIVEEVDPAGFFEKPYDPKELLNSIDLALSGAPAFRPKDLPRQLPLEQ
jgi:DNA-binding response OmpR family regulator